MARRISRIYGLANLVRIRRDLLEADHVLGSEPAITTIPWRRGKPWPVLFRNHELLEQIELGIVGQ